jgi:tetratricopeptide (TPR) repeat protein
MPTKTPRSAPRLPFRLPKVLIAVRTSRMCCRETGTARIFAPVRESYGESQLQAKFSQALVLHQQGKLADAERIYSEVLRQQPSHFDALHLLGVIAAQTRRTELGIELITKAIGLNAKVAAAHNNLGIALHDLKRSEEALASYDKAIAINPDYAEAYFNRGKALKELRRTEEALASYDKAIALGRNKTLFPMSKGLIWLMFHALQVRQGPMEN